MKKSHRSPRPILLFVGVFLVCLVASILLVIGLSGALGKHFAVGGYEDIGNVIGSTVGLSAGLAAAFVAIIIANLANNMLQEEKRREEFTFVNQIIEEALAPINQVAKNSANCMQ